MAIWAKEALYLHRPLGQSEAEEGLEPWHSDTRDHASSPHLSLGEMAAQGRASS